MLNSKKNFFFITYLLINLFLLKNILPHINSSKKQIKELQFFLKKEINKKSNNLILKKATSKNIKDLSNQIFKRISDRKKNIIRILDNLENLFIEIQNLNSKKGSLKKVKREINKIKKLINKYTKDKNNPIKQTCIDKIIFSIESIESAIYKKNKVEKSFIKKIINTTILGLITSASIAGIVFYKNSNNPKKELNVFINSTIESLKRKISSFSNPRKYKLNTKKEGGEAQTDPENSNFTDQDSTDQDSMDQDSTDQDSMDQDSTDQDSTDINSSNDENDIPKENLDSSSATQEPDKLKLNESGKSEIELFDQYEPNKPNEPNKPTISSDIEIDEAQTFLKTSSEEETVTSQETKAKSETESDENFLEFYETENSDQEIKNPELVKIYPEELIFSYDKQDLNIPELLEEKTNESEESENNIFTSDSESKIIHEEPNFAEEPKRRNYYQTNTVSPKNYLTNVKAEDFDLLDALNLTTLTQKHGLDTKKISQRDLTRVENKIKKYIKTGDENYLSKENYNGFSINVINAIKELIKAIKKYITTTKNKSNITSLKTPWKFHSLNIVEELKKPSRIELLLKKIGKKAGFIS